MIQATIKNCANLTYKNCARKKKIRMHLSAIYEICLWSCYMRQSTEKKNLKPWAKTTFCLAVLLDIKEFVSNENLKETKKRIYFLWHEKNYVRIIHIYLYMNILLALCIA